MSAGLPKSPVGKIDVAIAPSNSRRIYALIQTADQGSLWRSDDGGRQWKVVSWDRALIGRAGYYIRLARIQRECERGAGGEQQPPQVHRWREDVHQHGGCGDSHDIWIDPKDPDHSRPHE